MRQRYATRSGASVCSIYEATGGSSDYTLHITFVGEESARLILPPELMLFAAQSGFQIEVYRWDVEYEEPK